MPDRPDEHAPNGGVPGERRLTRSRTNRIIGGVCAGLATYLGVDVVMIRIAFVVLALAGGGGILLYVIAWILVPEEEPGAAPSMGPAPPVPAAESARLVFGGVLIAIGTILLINLVIPGVSRFFWPLALIAIGVAVIVQSSAWRR